MEGLVALLDRAVRILRAGGLVAFPTETVYGLGADASNPDAVHRIFEAKGRPSDHPVIVHLASDSQLPQWAREIPLVAEQLARRFWPGPMTLILRRGGQVLDAVTGGQDTVGLRVPSHPVAQSLLRAFGGGIAAPSANRFGHVSPTSAAHVLEELGDRVDLILDGGDCEVGIESTIVDCSRGAPIILRPGRITESEIEAVTGVRPQTAAGDSPRVSGSLASHYAPATPVVLVSSEDLDNRVRTAQQPVAVLARRSMPVGWTHGVWRKASTDARQYAHDLYANLRDLDHQHCKAILVEQVPQGPQWTAISDRLIRASGNLDGSIP